MAERSDSIETNSRDKANSRDKTNSRDKANSRDKEKTENLLQHPNLWRAGQLRSTPQQASGIASGYAELDAHLPGGGWPEAGLMEFLLGSAGIGELRLLAPALAALSRAQARWIAWINPPFIPYAPALQAVGIDINRILLIHPRSHEDLLWAMERAAKSGGCSCVLAWPEEQKLKLKDTQRLQLASKQGRSLTCLFRPHTAHQHASMAELRLALKNAPPGEIRLDIVKRRGGWPLQDVSLQAADVHDSRHAGKAQIREQLALWRTTHRWQALKQKPAADLAQPVAEMSGSVSGEVPGRVPGNVSGEMPLHAGQPQPESAMPVH